MTGLDFHLSERPIVGFFPAQGRPVIVLPYLEHNKLAAPGLYEITPLTYTDEQGPEDAVGNAVRALPEVQRLAVEYLNMRVLELKLVQRHLPASFLSDGTMIMDALRLRKDAAEIELMRRAAQISDAALGQVIAKVHPGMTEQEVANMLTLAQRAAGAQKESFETTVLAGANAANPHGKSGDYVLQRGDVLLIDFGAVYHGYVSDITRSFFIGEPGAKEREIYEVVRAANAAGCAAAAPGVPCSEVDRATRKVVDEAGYGPYFIHRTGHGIGIEVHERPYIREGYDALLEPGMTFTVEPGIYLPGEFGVRIEDDILITETGAESLTTFERTLTVIGSPHHD
jgi:Xaa-Pro aminopeptidase